MNGDFLIIEEMKLSGNIVQKYMHLKAMIEAELLKHGIDASDKTAYLTTLGANIEAYSERKSGEADEFHEHLRALCDLAKRSAESSQDQHLVLIHMIECIIMCYWEEK